MTNKEALAFLDTIVAQAPMSRQMHAQAVEAKNTISTALHLLHNRLEKDASPE